MERKSKAISGNTNISNAKIELDSPVFNAQENIDIAEFIQHKTNNFADKLNNFYNSSEEFITPKKCPDTNIIDLGRGGATFNFPIEHIPKYFSIVEECRLSGCTMHIQEKQTAAASGIMIDFDRYQISNTREINKDHFSKFSNYIIRLLQEFVDLRGLTHVHIFFIQKPKLAIDCTRAEYLEKSGKSQIYKDGFHVLIPEIQISRPLKKFIIGKIIERSAMTHIFGDIDNSLCPPEDMLDKMSSCVNTFLYGSSKYSKQPYKLTHCYKFTIDEFCGNSMTELDIQNQVEFENVNWVYELSLSFILENVQLGNYYVQPWLKKGIYSPRPHIIADLQLLNIDKNLEETEEVSILRQVLQDPDAYLVYKLLTILDKSYYTDYAKWRNCIFAIADSSTKYKFIAEWFSKQSTEKWDKSSFDSIWEEAINKQYTGDKITIRSLYFWAKECNKEKYEEVFQNSYRQILEKYAYEYDGDIEQGMVAVILYNIFQHKFVADYIPTDKGEKLMWWEFVMEDERMKTGEVYKWRKESEPNFLYLYIQDKLPAIYAQVQQRIKSRKENSKNENEGKYWAYVENRLKITKKRLHQQMFIKHSLEMAQHRFLKRGFCEDLDQYDDIIGVANGVLKLTPEPKLITGFHEYKISKSTVIDYIPYCADNPHVQLLEKAFSDTFPEPDVCEFWKLYYSLFIDPSEVDAAIAMEVGGGSNGKSFRAELLSNLLGTEYSSKLSINLLTGDREIASGTNSALMAADGKLFVYFSEPNGPETLNSGRLKEMFSGEKQSGREVYGKHKVFRMRASPLIMSNFDLRTDCTDHGFWRRCFYYKSKVKFCSNPDKNNIYERKDDKNFINKYKKDPDVMRAMLSILVHYNNILRVKYGGDIHSVPCPTIRRETEEFRNRQDTVNRFITQMVFSAPESQKEIPLTEIAATYTAWYNMNIGHYKKPTSEQIISQFENSSVAKHIIRKRDFSLVLMNHRMRNGADDEPQQGESYIGETQEQKSLIPNKKTIDDSLSELTAKSEKKAKNGSSDTLILM